MSMKNLATLGLASFLFAQVPPSEFEVASIRTSAPVQQTAAGRQVVGGLTLNSSRFAGSSMALRDYLSIAYGIPADRIDGPDWMSSERFDIQAKVPEGASGKQKLPEMLRRLLNDRFGVRSHVVQKEFGVWSLTRISSGISAKSVELDPEDEISATSLAGSPAGISLRMGRGSVLTMSADQMEVKKMPLAQFAEALNHFMDRPVLDRTGTTEAYEFAIPLTTEDTAVLRVRAGLRAGLTFGPAALRMSAESDLPSLHRALEKLGLRLQSARAELDVLVIDEIRRSPTEN